MTYLLDPDAVLDFAISWADWLSEGESIASHTVTATTGVTVDSSSEADGIVTFWLTDGVSGSNPKITCHIVTDAGRIDDRTISIRVTER